MAKSELDNISERRRLLQNPYAFVEHLEASQPDQYRNSYASASDEQIGSSRALLQNPYAHLDGKGGFSALTGTDIGESAGTAPHAREAVGQVRKTSKKPVYYSGITLESKVKDIHRLIWKKRKSIWGDNASDDPVEMLDPAVALNLLGFDFQIAEGLGQFHGAGGMLEVAGLIDRESRTVRISGQFPISVRKFTAAHELGHAVLHPSASGVHRDRPLDGGNLSRERTEIEADKFATLFLMPAKLVKQRFVAMFGTGCFALDENTSFALSGQSDRDLQRQCKTMRDLSRLLASAGRYNGRQFSSLATQFQVSIEAMAIRIEELGLLAV